MPQRQGFKQYTAIYKKPANHHGAGCPFDFFYSEFLKYKTLLNNLHALAVLLHLALYCVDVVHVHH